MWGHQRDFLSRVHHRWQEWTPSFSKAAVDAASILHSIFCHHWLGSTLEIVRVLKSDVFQYKVVPPPQL